MSDLTKDFEVYVNNYKEQKGMQVPATEAKSFNGNGVSFSVADGKIVASYDNPKLAERAKLLSANHARTAGIQSSKDNNLGRVF